MRSRLVVLQLLNVVSVLVMGKIAFRFNHDFNHISNLIKTLINQIQVMCALGY